MIRRKKTTARPVKGTSDLVLFPPLPRLASPPRLPADPRQEAAMHVLGIVAGIARTTMHVAGPIFTIGFHASAVDLGKLQGALAHGVARLDATQVKDRWDEVLAWMLRVLRRWVQRCKTLRVERRAAGIRVRIETQDDHGYYAYGFDVFPGRRHPKGMT